MTATAVPQDLATRSWNGLMKAAALATLFVVLVAASFGLGRSTADDSVTIVRNVVPSTATADPALDLPPISLHTRAATADVPPVATDDSCGRTVHTPPC
jgi:hypothetical protein